MKMVEPADRQRKVRIKLSLAAYAYEFCNHAWISDAEFDKLAMEIDTTVSTGGPLYDAKMRKRAEKLDKFFADHFSTDTGMWIHSHPELAKVAGLYAWLMSDAQQM